MIAKLLSLAGNLFSSASADKHALFNKAIGSARFVAIDLELTSLNPSTTSITSIGFVEGGNARLDLSRCGYSVINTAADLGQSPVIHGFTHDVLCQGELLENAIKALVPVMHNAILVFHNASLDLRALNNAFNALDLPSLDVVYIDTLQLALYQLNKQHQVLPSDSATLAMCRQRLDLPSVPEHNALDDALATLTLLYAQLAQLGISQQDSFNVLSHTKALGRFRLGK